MSVHVETIADRPMRADALLKQAMDAAGFGVARKKARGFIERGKVKVSGWELRHSSDLLGPGAVFFEVLIPEDDLVGRTSERSATIELVEEDILHRGDNWVAVEKPIGVPTDRTRDAKRDSMSAAVERLLGTKMWAVHRLDRDTSGVLLLATSKAAAAELGGLFQSREVEKRYLALCQKGAEDLPEELVATLGDVGGKKGVAEDGKPAQTSFCVIEDRGRIALVEARPHTGLTHQVRAHLSHLGWSIVGDVRYGGPPAARVMLHAKSITLHGATIESQTVFPSS
ncbi:MAG: RluA family pseudouridine synthase [Bradymonadia bacterium]|jgi:RluA family pseudouridine synthase